MIVPIKFGTDGWRGVIAKEFTFERVALVARVSAEVLADTYGDRASCRSIVVGFDRRFLAAEFAQHAAEAIQQAGFDVLLADSYAPTPAFSWSAFEGKTLGAIVVTASHNPPEYLGLKVKSPFGGSVPPSVTQEIEKRLDLPLSEGRSSGTLQTFDPWASYCQQLRSLVDIEAIRSTIDQGKLSIFADVMYGAGSSGLERLISRSIHELHSHRDPLFGGNAPEPLAKYVPELINRIRDHSQENPDTLRVGFVFDGDCDRIAAMDGQGNFFNSQRLIPILIEHLSQKRGFTGEVIKTVSGSDLMDRVASYYQIPLHETPIGYKYITDRMVTHAVLMGGEESGGIGYGHHIPERDALLSALYVLETLVSSGQDLGQLYQGLQEKTQFSSEYDRIDLHLSGMELRDKLVDRLTNHPPQIIAGQSVKSCLDIDGYKFRLADDRWLLIRFSGTEPVLRLYCEAKTMDQVQETLQWAESWANS